MQGVEMLTDEGRNEETAEAFSSSALRAYRGPQGVNFAVGANKPGLAAFVAGARPGLSAGLCRERSDGALMFESVTMLVRALAAGVIAIQTGAAGTADHGELCGAP